MEGERDYANRYREFPTYDVKAVYGRQPDLRDPYEKEAYREWERNYRDWYEKYYKGCSMNAIPRQRSPIGRENFPDNRFLLPPQTRRDQSPYNRGHRDNYPPPLLPRLRPVGGGGGGGGGGGYQEKLLPRDTHTKGTRKSKEREPVIQSGDSRGNKHKKHRKRRKEESEGVSKTGTDGSRKHREPHGDDGKRTEHVFAPTSKDDATPVRDEPMDAESIALKPLSDKDKREKPRVKVDKTKRKADTQPKRETPSKVIKVEKVGNGEKAKPVSTEPPPKKVKEEPPKNENPKHVSSQKDDKAMLPRKVHLKAIKDNPDNKQSKDEKNKKEHAKDSKPEKPAVKEDKSKKAADKPRAAESKPEKRKRKPDDKPTEKEPEKTVKNVKVEAAEAPKPPATKPKSEPEIVKPEKIPEKDKTPTSTATVKKIKLNRETGKKIANTEAGGGTEEAQDKSEPAAPAKPKTERAKGKVRKKVPAPDGSGSTLVDYTR